MWPETRKLSNNKNVSAYYKIEKDFNYRILPKKYILNNSLFILRLDLIPFANYLLKGELSFICRLKKIASCEII
ncbi:hypothetical protein BpHYR1_048575 [Brachionus plicatilis]|uniref:Uncharacterized protein n=1 Tax=Brachionus plicatilis TaxID=10195 RepID=A0A3M7QXN2_BRAPC|nr:hypothetical protein BpHYR1_048575 [Brachionus plicatilis]